MTGFGSSYCMCGRLKRQLDDYCSPACEAEAERQDDQDELLQGALFSMPEPEPAAEVDPRSVPCPVCHAKPGGPCKRPSGHAVWGGDSHAPRRERAHAEARRAA